MLTKPQLQDLVQRRRDVQDLDLEWYLKQKNEILELIIELKNGNRDVLNDERISELEKNIQLGKKKTELGLELELKKYHMTLKEVENYDNQIRSILTEYIISAAAKYKQLNEKIDYAKKVLESRERLNNIITEYFSKTKIISLSLRELKELFEKESTEWDMILESGRLVKEDKNEALNNIYEFKFSKNSSFTLSTTELSSKIKEQIATCNEVSASIEHSRQIWKEATAKLISLLDRIDEEVTL